MQHAADDAPVTAAYLAKTLGISRTTVSNAYNRPDQLSPILRKRILDAAAEFGYPGPDPMARSLRTRTTGAIGLLLTEQLSYAFRDPAALAFLEGLTGECDRANIGLLLIPAQPDAIQTFGVRQAAVDGFVAYSVAEGDRQLAAMIKRQLPLVICDQPHNTDADLVGIDDAGAARQIADHLAGLGHRRIGVVTMRLNRFRHDGPVDVATQENAAFHVQRGRLAGLRDGFTACGVAWDRVPVIERFEHTTADGAAGAAELLAIDPGLTAIIATSDVLALGVLAELERRRQRVPDDVSVTGFDGVRAAVSAKLTTIGQTNDLKGRQAARLLLDRAERRGTRRVLLDTELLVGCTTARPRH